MKQILSCLAAALMMSLAAPAFAQKAAAAKPTGASVATVNGTVIPAALGNMLIQEQMSQGKPDTAELKAQVRDHLIRREVLLQTARKTGIEKNAEIKMRMDYVRDEVLVNAYLESWAQKNPINEATAKAEYDRAAKAAGDTEYKARHILVEKEAEAKAIVSKLQTGAKFSDLVKDSIDPGSKDNGGDLGWSRPNAFVPPFAEALVKLQKGQFTAIPVQTQYGFHIIMLDDSRKAETPPYEAVKARVMQTLQQQAVQAYVNDLMSKAKISE